MDLVCFLLIGFLAVTTEGYEEPNNVLTLDQRINIFGTNVSENLPPIQFVTIQRLPVPDGKWARKRPVNLLQYRLTLGGEDVVLTLKHNKDLLAPGCVVHKHQRNGYKILYPCGRGVDHCLYTGKSDNHTDSWAAVNTCYGLKGVISIRNTSLVIAPLNRKRSIYRQNGSMENEVHVIYRFVGKKVVFKGAGIPEDDTAESAAEDTSTRFIETSVVIDPSINNLYRDKAEEYIQTSFNVASKLFEHRSLGTSIKLCLTEIHLYESYDSIPVPFTTDAQQILNDFCKWHAKISTTTPDCSIIYTRQDIQYMNQSSTVGLASREHMCVEERNCAVVQDRGPVSGETMAHEIGHLLGMKHDSEYGECNSSSTAGLMITGATGSTAFRWSACSARAIRAFLSTPKADCLRNRPEGSVYSFGFNRTAPLPGTIYTRNQQCKMLFGEPASYCSGYDLPPEKICGNLLCRPDDTAACVYLSQVLDGSDCNNTRTWCMSSKCVAMETSYSVPPQDGAWTSWGSYLPCSRSCGGGVLIRKRTCTNPIPRYGGRTCDGSGIEAKICNMQACVGNFRKEQCIQLGNNNTDWAPVETLKGDKSCSISCTNGSVLIPYSRHYKDGTECNLERDVQYARCIRGKCRRFGCDGVLDSYMEDDKCGVCNGTDDNCQHTFGNYETSGLIGAFRTVLVIPKNRFSVLVKQKSIYSFISVYVSGQRVINPALGLQSLSDTYTVHGMRLKYSRSPDRLEIDGPTTSNIVIQVYQRYYIPPSLEYEYYSREEHQTSQYHWSVQWSDCTKSCGTGFQIPVVRCLNLSSNAVDDYLCDIKNKPNEIRKPCNAYFCPPEWKTSDLGPCSVTCGAGGTRHRTVHCERENNGTKLILNNGCDVNTKPLSVINCTLVECPGIWKTGPWSECSKSCGEGVQRRWARCFGKDGRPTKEKLCNDTKPDHTNTCLKAYCPNTPIGPECKNKKSNCKYYYGNDICYGNYSLWAEKNCMRECSICSPRDDPRCQLLANLGKHPCTTYPAWAQVNCRYLCQVCVDKPQCQSFLDVGVNICAAEHANFARRVCPSMCGYCGPCEDTSSVPCKSFDKRFCNSLSMRTRCRRYCGFCRH